MARYGLETSKDLFFMDAVSQNKKGKLRKSVRLDCNNKIIIAVILMTQFCKSV